MSLSDELFDMISKMQAAKGKPAPTRKTVAESKAETLELLRARKEAAGGVIPPQLTGVCDIVERCAKQRASHG